jgi:hypothetical protein
VPSAGALTCRDDRHHSNGDRMSIIHPSKSCRRRGRFRPPAGAAHVSRYLTATSVVIAAGCTSDRLTEAPEELRPGAAVAAAAGPAGCFATRRPTITLRGLQNRYDRKTGTPSNTFVDARTARWTAPAGARAPVRMGAGSNICWHGGQVLGTGNPSSTSWSTYHDTYAFSLNGPGFIIENVYAENVGDGVKWFEIADNWTVRRVHLKDMHDDCVETDWMKGGRIQDVLFEGCYVFLATRPRSSASGSGASNIVTVDGAVVWMKPTQTVYDGPAPSTGGVLKVDNASNSRSPRMVLKNIVLRVDVKPGVGNACLNPYNLVKQSVNNTVVWLGSGNYPCLPLPAGWTLTRDKGVYDRAVAAWKARNPGL